MYNNYTPYTYVRFKQKSYNSFSANFNFTHWFASTDVHFAHSHVNEVSDDVRLLLQVLTYLLP